MNMNGQLTYLEALHLVKMEHNSREACMLVDSLVKSDQITAGVANALLKYIRENL